jgi:hypothetical protein
MPADGMSAADQNWDFGTSRWQLFKWLDANYNFFAGIGNEELGRKKLSRILKGRLTPIGRTALEDWMRCGSRKVEEPLVVWGLYWAVEEA